ncbi:agamous-like MADS-box protein AGL80 [Primulina tabacum]|uniref:agamous-like MADS-box protein AGL80 n=1 Tax=Primulina tabacum TaxID=48773 RepID=UPI003F596A5C
MARKKITLAYLNKESERKASFKKRNKGLMKKVEELSTLCGVEACAVTYSEFQPQPEVWPSPPEARSVMERFMERPEMEKTRFMQNQMSFTQQRIEKARNKLRRLQRENKRKELTIFMFQCIEGKANIRDFDVRDTCEMNVVINEVLTEITERMEKLKASGEGPSSSVAKEEEVLKAADGEGSSSVAAAGMRTEEAAELQGFLLENENPPGFSYWNMLMSPIEGVDDFGCNNVGLNFPPDVPDSIRDAPSAPPKQTAERE